MEEEPKDKKIPLPLLIGGAFTILIGIIGFMFATGALSQPDLIGGSSQGTTHVMVFDGEKYTPSDLDIKVGDTVEFQNKSDKPFWPASNIHPTHGIYPDFDPKDAVMGGENWSFTFDKAGNWRYHDHLYPYMVGVITVK